MSSATMELPGAEFSPDRVYRYALRRRWGAGQPLAFILLNPSTADETQDDPTIRRCIGYAKAWGYGGLVLGNLFALRSTDPKMLYAHPFPVGGDNSYWLARIVEEAGGGVVCGWGAHGEYLDRGRSVLADLRACGHKPHALALTKAGQPGHPLYLKADLRPFEIGAQR